MGMKTISLFCVSVIAAMLIASVSWAIPVDVVPNPQETASSFVEDQAGVLGPEYISLIDAVSRELESKVGAELAVVTVDDLDGLTVEDYAEKLFKRFGIGKKEQDNGLLLLFSQGDRKVRIEVGYGLEGVINDAKAGRMLDEHAVPLFKQGEYGRGLFETALTVAQEVAQTEGVAVSMAAPKVWPAQIEPPATEDEAVSSSEPSTANKASLTHHLVGYAIVMLAATIASYIFTALRVRRKRARAARKQALGNGAALPLVLWVVGGVSMYAIGKVNDRALLPLVVFLATSIGFTYAHYAFRKMFGHRIDRYELPCASCGKPMQLIDDITDNKFLKPEEIAEERAGGMEYEFWLCEPCNHTERLEVTLNKAERCPECARRTLTQRKEVISIATTTSEGKERIHFECQNEVCGYRRAEDRRIPKKSSSSSGGFSSSSSGGSSFGGGSSGGGGASRGW